MIDVRLLELFRTYSSIVKFKNVPACLCMVDWWHIDLLCALLLILFHIFQSVTDVGPTYSGWLGTACRFVAATWYRFFPRLALVLKYIPRPLCLSKVTFLAMSPCGICRLIKYVCHHGVLVSDVDRVERFTLTLRLFDDVSTAAWFTFSIPTSNFSMTRRNFQSVLSVLFFYSIKSLWLFLHKHLCAIKML